LPVTSVRAITLTILSAVVIGLLIQVDQATIDAAPGLPHVLFGVAKTQSGTPVPSGTLLEARIGNVNYAQTVNPSTGVGSQDTRTHSLTGGGLNYGASAHFQICADNPDTGAVEGGADGDQIVFYVAGIQAEAQPSTVFSPGGSLRVDLTISSLTAPTAVPATASTSACVTPQSPSAPTATATASPSTGGGGGAAPPATSTPEPIPGVSAWGLVVLGAVLAALTVLTVHRRPDPA
jgi:hypothetical protein